MKTGEFDDPAEQVYRTFVRVLYICMRARVCVRAYVCVRECVRACACACACDSMCVCECVCVDVRVAYNRYACIYTTCVVCFVGDFMPV